MKPPLNIKKLMPKVLYLATKGYTQRAIAAIMCISQYSVWRIIKASKEADKEKIKARYAERNEYNKADKSICCLAKTVVIRQLEAMENEVSSILVCTKCNTEAPKIGMFNNLKLVQQFFIDLHAHKTNNNLK